MMRFDDEISAERYVIEQVQPFCNSLVRQPSVQGGLRPDLCIRLQCLPDFSIYIEIKCCDHGSRGGQASALCAGIAQASSYADRLRQPVFVAPLAGSQATDLDWTANSLGSALLLGGQFNVGCIYFGQSRYQPCSAIGFMLGGAQLVFLTRDSAGRCDARVHSNARHLLKYKERFGSSAFRREGGVAR